jgi:hypothetical protein
VCVEKLVISENTRAQQQLLTTQTKCCWRFLGTDDVRQREGDRERRERRERQREERERQRGDTIVSSIDMTTL